MKQGFFTRLGVTLLVVALAVALRLALDPLLGAGGVPYITLFVPLVFLGWYARLRMALFALVIAGVAVVYLVLPPRFSFTVHLPRDLIGLAVYAIFGSLGAVLGEQLRKAQLEAADQRDIARKSQAEQKRIESLYRSIAAAVPDFVWVTDADGKLEYVNEQWHAYTGSSIAQVNADGWQTLNHPDDREALAKAWDAARQAGQSFQAQFRYRRHDGVYRWFWGRAIPIKDDKGHILRWVGVGSRVIDHPLGK
jgi:PAS domain S-box-containing protein